MNWTLIDPRTTWRILHKFVPVTVTVVPTVPWVGDTEVTTGGTRAQGQPVAPVAPVAEVGHARDRRRVEELLKGSEPSEEKVRE